MLHRITELSVKSANGTNTNADRNAMQKEITQILSEIDRIGDSTTFNEIPIFKGRDADIYEDDGAPVIASVIPVSNYTVSAVNLGMAPFSGSSSPDTLDLCAVVNSGSNADGTKFKLIFGGGNTSHSGFRVTDEGGTMRDIYLREFTVDPDSYHYYLTPESSWTREMNYNKNGFNLCLEQSIKAVNSGSTEKYYELSYKLINNSSGDIDATFMFTADTSYGGDGAGDHEEAYYIGGTQVNKNKIYATDSSTITTPRSTYEGSNVDYSAIPTDFSIVNTTQALSFSEKISLGNMSDVTNLSIGEWNHTREYGLSYFDNPATLLSESNESIINQDVAFCVMWNMGTISSGASKSESLNYGIQAIASDSNLHNVNITYDRRIMQRHEPEIPVWIQSGAQADSGLYITFGEMNKSIVGLDGMDISTEEGARRSIDRVKYGLGYISNLRSHIGAQQNRLEHTIANNDNIAENLTSAESRIRDADIADEMVELSAGKILEQVGEAMMSQADQSTEGILKLLQ